MRADLVGLDMRAEPGAEGLCEFVHLCAVARKDGAVDDESRGPERIEVLALVLVDEILLLGLAADMVRGAGLLGDERIRLGVFLRAHGGREDWMGAGWKNEVLIGGVVDGERVGETWERLWGCSHDRRLYRHSSYTRLSPSD